MRSATACHVFKTVLVGYEKVRLAGLFTLERLRIHATLLCFTVVEPLL